VYVCVLRTISRYRQDSILTISSSGNKTDAALNCEGMQIPGGPGLGRDSVSIIAFLDQTTVAVLCLVCVYGWVGGCVHVCMYACVLCVMCVYVYVYVQGGRAQAYLA